MKIEINGKEAEILSRILGTVRERPGICILEIRAGTTGGAFRNISEEEEKEESGRERMKDTPNGMDSEAFKVFADRMGRDRGFRMQTLMVTVSLLIRNIEELETRVSALEREVMRHAAPETGGENGENGENGEGVESDGEMKEADQ